MEPVVLLAAVVLALLIVALHQWVLDSSLFELGEASWFPAGGDIPAATALARSLLSGLIPLLGTVIAAIFVVTMPFRVWVWGVVAVLTVTVVLSPVLAVYRYDVRPPTAGEASILDTVPDMGCDIVVVSDARDGPVNGYAIGGPFRDVIGVSDFALSNLRSEQVGALLAHEACHHREKHVLLRGVVSVSILSVGAAIATTFFETLVPLAALGFLATVLLERIVVHWVIRRLEYRADAVAAQYTSEDAVRTLLVTLNDATTVDQARVPWHLGLFSTHPSYADRIARLRKRVPVGDDEQEPSGTVQ